jgi:hypothetical protein
MPDSPSPQMLEAEFDALTARAGLTIPPERRAAYLTAFADLRGQLTLLNTPRGADIEPAHVFRMPVPEQPR